MIEYAARLLWFADELEAGDHVDSRVSLLRHGVEAVLTLAGSIERDASMAGHEGPSSADADELRHEGEKVMQFAYALGFDAVDEAPDSEEQITTSAAPAAATRRKRKREILEEAGRTGVGMDKLRRNLRGQEDGLQGALKGATGLADLQALITSNGGEIAIDLRQKDSGEVVVEAMVGACNNGDRSFFEEGAVLKTAKVVRAVVDALAMTSADLLYQHNRNFGGCEKTVDGRGQTNCRPHRQYPPSLLAAEKQITAALHKAVSMDLPAARYLLVHEFGDFRASHDEQEDGTPVVRTERVGDLTVLQARGMHLCLPPNSVSAVESTAKVRHQLMAAAGLCLPYTDEDLGRGMIRLVRALVTGSAESDGYQQKLSKDKTKKLVGMLDVLNGKPLAEIKKGLADVGKLYGGRGLTAEDGRKGDKKLKAAGGMNSGGGGNQTGNAGWSGAGHAARDFSAEGAGEKYFGLHLKVPADQLSATLQRLVQEDGSLEPLPPLCDIDVSPGYPGVTKAKGKFGLDEGRVVLRVHNSNRPNVCVSEGAIPVTTRTPPFKVPAWAIGPLRAGMVVIRNQSNASALQKNKKN
eukprot:g5710.t1